MCGENDRESAATAERHAAARDAAALMLLALVLNLIRIGAKSIAHDEAGTALYAQLGLESLFRLFARSDLNMALYHIVMNGWVALFGEGEAALRVPSAIFGALAAGAIYFLGRRLFGRTAGVVAALLFAFDAFQVQYAQTARAYTLLVAVTTLSTLSFARVFEKPSRGNFIAYTVSGLLALYTHYFAAYVLAAHAIALLLVRPDGLRDRRWWLVAAAIATLGSPLLLVVAHSGAVHRFNWIAPPSPGDVWSVLVELAGGSRFSLAAILLGAGSGILSSSRRRPWACVLVSAWLLVPIGLSYLVSLAVPMFLAYYLIICLPPLLLLAGAGIAALRPAALAWMAAAVLIAVNFTRLTGYYAADALQDWRAAASYTLNASRTGDGIVFFPDTAAKPFGYYARRSTAEIPANLESLPFDGYERIWFVVRESDVAIMRSRFDELRARLGQSFRVAERRSFGLVTVELNTR